MFQFFLQECPKNPLPLLSAAELLQAKPEGRKAKDGHSYVKLVEFIPSVVTRLQASVEVLLSAMVGAIHLLEEYYYTRYVFK